jgi:CRISPR-associated protein Csx10
MDPLPLEFSLTLDMLGDWHVGSGAGRPGDVDRLVARDADGFPYIPAKTVTGILRDACEQVAWGLDEGRPGPWCSWVEYLFGSQPSAEGQEPAAELPRPAALSIRPARLADELRRALGTRPALAAAATFVKPGVALDPGSGRALDDHLRFDELVRGGVRLSAAVTWSPPEDPQAALTSSALLIAGARALQRLGGKRRRGSGRCECQIDGARVGAALDWIANHVENVPAVPKRESDPPPTPPATAATGSWKAVQLRLECRSPLAVPARTVGNVVETLDFLPGTQLLPEVTRRLGKLGVDVRSAIGCGDLLVTHATVEVGGHRGQPVPFALRQDKLDGGLGKGGQAYNLWAEQPPATRQVKPHAPGWLGATRAGFLPPFGVVERTVRTHNTIQDRVQRPTADVGGVYSYEAIVAGSVLCAEVRFRASLAEQLGRAQRDWWKVLAGTYKLGRAKKDDYGDVAVTVVGTAADVPATRPVPGGVFAVWLLSDVLLDDARLRPTREPAVLAEVLGSALGVHLTLLRCEARDRRTESWNVRWGLPRPSLFGLAAGSCFEFRLDGPAPDDLGARLAAVEAGGIGRRRAEGYGQLRIHDPLLADPLSQAKADVKAPPPNPAPTAGPVLRTRDPGHAWARLLEKEAWRREIAALALARAADAAWRKRVLGIGYDSQGSSPPASQLGALRSAAGSLQDLAAWLAALGGVRNRCDKWPQGSLQNLGDLAAKVFDLLDPDQRLKAIVLTDDGERALTSELRAEAVHTLIDACIRAHRREEEHRTKAAHEAAAQGGIHGA